MQSESSESSLEGLRRGGSAGACVFPALPAHTDRRRTREVYSLPHAAACKTHTFPHHLNLRYTGPPSAVNRRFHPPNLFCHQHLGPCVAATHKKRRRPRRCLLEYAFQAAPHRRHSAWQVGKFCCKLKNSGIITFYILS